MPYSVNTSFPLLVSYRRRIRKTLPKPFGGSSFPLDYYSDRRQWIASESQAPKGRELLTCLNRFHGNEREGIAGKKNRALSRPSLPFSPPSPV